MYEACHMVKAMDLYKNFYNKPIVEVVETSPRIQVCILTSSFFQMLKSSFNFAVCLKRPTVFKFMLQTHRM